MKITFPTYEKCYPKRLKRFFQADINYTTYSKYIPNMERAVVGNIPIEIIKLFPKHSRGEQIKKVQEALSITTLQLRKSYSNVQQDELFTIFDENYRPSKYIKKVAKKGEKCLNTELAKIFGEENVKATLKFAGEGNFGNVYQLSLYNKDGQKIMHDKALKVYHRIIEGHPYYSIIHNNYAEANFWTFLKKIAGHNLAKTQFTKHYISDLQSGYCMTEFIDENISKTRVTLPIFDLFNIRVPHDNNLNPAIMGKVYDGGGYEKEENFISDKVILKYIKMLFYSPPKEFDIKLKNLIALAENPKTQFRDKIQKAINEFDW